MSAGNDWFRSLLAPDTFDETPPDTEPPPDFDGGARKSTAPPAPSMNLAIRRAHYGNVAGLDDRHR